MHTLLGYQTWIESIARFHKARRQLSNFSCSTSRTSDGWIIGQLLSSLRPGSLFPWQAPARRWGPGPPLRRTRSRLPSAYCPLTKESRIYSSERASEEFKAKKKRGPWPTPPSGLDTLPGTRSEDFAPQGPAGSPGPADAGPGPGPGPLASQRRGWEGWGRPCVSPVSVPPPPPRPRTEGPGLASGLTTPPPPAGRRRGAEGRGRSLPFPRVHRARWLSGHVPGPRRSVPAELTPSSLPGSGLRRRLCRRRHEHLPPHRGLVPPGGHHHPAA